MTRKKLIFSFLAFVSIMTLGCKEDEPAIDDKKIDNRPPTEVVETLTETLKSADSLSVFTEALKNINLTQEEVEQGLTIFAPLNNGTIANNSRQSANSRVSSSKEDGTSFTEEQLRDHIIKGILKFADLSDGTILVSLSGKTYKITKIGDQVWINGVLILPKEVLSGSRETVFAVKSLLSNTEQTDAPTPASTSIEITVWDASQWSPENTNGVLSTGADVALYRSHEDYTNSNPAYELKATGEDGKVVFTDVEPGTYYIEVSKDNLSNIFDESDEPVNGLYVGIAADGIFQNQEEVDNSYQEGAVVGSIRWLDANADGVLNEGDYVPLPYESVTASDNNIARVDILIDVTYEEEEVAPFPQLDEGAIEQAMDDAVNNFNAWFINLAITDGLLSDDADTPPTGYLSEGLDDFSFAANNQAITAIWLEAYPIINDLNVIIANNPTNIELLGNATALRAFIYLKLTTYFGGLPLHTGFANNMMEYYSSESSSQSDVIAFVTSELETAKNMLPDNSSDVSSLTNVSINALLAQAALVVKDYQSVFEYTGNIVNSSHYELASSPTAIADEALWSTSGNLANLESYFGHQTLPYIRLTEVYLMHAEAGISLWGDYWEQAVNIMTPIIDRNGREPLNPPMEQEELLSALQTLWKAEMPKEGNRFANLVRWEKAVEVLGSKGFTPNKHELFPIPQFVLDNNPDLFQNPGY